MRKKLLIQVGSLAVLAFAFTTLTRGIESSRSEKDKKNKIEWQTFDRGLELARKEKKMLVVDIYTDWCHWCKVMDKETFSDAKVIKFANENLVMAKLDAETNERFKFRDAHYSGRQLSMMLGVQGFPTTVFMSSEGELITSVSGYIPADRFTLILKYLDGDWYEKMKFDEFVKKEEQKN